MEKNTNPDSDAVPGALPSYTEIFQPNQPPSAPPIEPIPLPIEQQPLAQTQAIYNYQGAQVVICPNCQEELTSQRRYLPPVLKGLSAACICVLGLFCCNYCTLG